MSHGGGDSEVVEPNLTPLLDLILQIVMFFMLVTNLSADEMKAEIKLPVASQAKPIDAKVAHAIFLNVTKEGSVLITDGDPMADPRVLASYARNKFTYLKKGFGDQVAKDSMVIIRADSDARFEYLFRVMTAFKQAGFEKLSFRARLPGGG